MRHACLLLAVGLLGAACGAIVVEGGTPRLAPPARRPYSVAFTLAPAVEDEIEYPFGHNGLRAFTIRGWRATLGRAFQDRTFRAAFARPDGWQAADRVVSIDEAVPELFPAGVTGLFGQLRVSARIRFRAKLYDAERRLLGESSGVAVARSATDNPDEVVAVLDDAVAALFDRLARELL